MASNDGIIDGRASVLDHSNISCGTAHFKIYPVGCSQINQGTHDGSRRTGQHGQDGAFFYLIDLHYTAVSAHDHKRYLDSCLPHTLFGTGGRVQHFRQDTGIDGRRPGSSGQPVQLRDIRSRRGRQLHFFRYMFDPLLLFTVIHPKSHGSHHNLGSLSLQAVQLFLDLLIGQLFLFDKGIKYFNHFPGGNIDICDFQLFFRQQSLQPASGHTDDSHFGYIALYQCIGGLRGGVGHKDNFLRPDVIIRQTILKCLNNSGCHAGFIVMGRLDRGFSDDLVGGIVDCHRLRMRPPHVNPYSY